MYTYKYSASENYFFPSESELAIPTDAVEVTNEIFEEFVFSPRGGKIRASGKDGLPAWVDEPEAVIDYVLMATRNKDNVIASAKQKISFWQTELSLNLISNEDKESLILWVKYIQAVQAIDVSSASSEVNINWPNEPKE